MINPIESNEGIEQVTQLAVNLDVKDITGALLS